MSNISKVIGKRIRYLRKKKGWSQEELAFRANLNRAYFGQLERGNKSATVETLEKIALALNVSMEELFKNVQPAPEEVDNKNLSLLIEKIHSLDSQDQETMLSLFDVLFIWKDRKRG